MHTEVVCVHKEWCVYIRGLGDKKKRIFILNLRFYELSSSGKE